MKKKMISILNLLLLKCTSAQLLLPVDQSIFTNFDDALELEVATPIKGDLVLTPETAFETYVVLTKRRFARTFSLNNFQSILNNFQHTKTGGQSSHIIP